MRLALTAGLPITAGAALAPAPGRLRLARAWSLGHGAAPTSNRWGPEVEQLWRSSHWETVDIPVSFGFLGPFSEDENGWLKGKGLLG